jgi:hypothetical protein
MKDLNRFLIILAIFCLCSCSLHSNRKIIGIKIYDYNGNCDDLAYKWAEMGINTAFISATLAANNDFRQALRKRDISVFIIFPVFQDPELLKWDSSMFAVTAKGLKAKDDWVEFVCPSRQTYRKAKIDEISDLVSKLDPDGISIDFIRQFVFWEMIYPGHDPASIDRACFCDSCMAGFSLQQGIVIPDSCKTTSQMADWIENNHPDSWNNFRCDQITTMVKELAGKAKEIKPDLKVNFHAVPWRDEDFDGANTRIAAQDLRKINPYVDYISPMCYSQMVKRDAAWISDVIGDMDRRASGKILPSIQVYPYYIDWSFTRDDFKLCILEALKNPSRGVVFFSWTLFEKDSSRMETVSEVLGRKMSR